ncbi:MAG: chemotaxis protein CheX [Pseudomonadaceae bacterium]|jgi:hypothetical protein|nr:chemotaxis protein CheX [Pseudomonadaceae bacterium]
MSDAAVVMSKILVLDDELANLAHIKQLCADAHLLGIKPNLDSFGGVLELLASSLDLGGVLIYENYSGRGRGLSMLHMIANLRPELPIFLRRNADAPPLIDTDARAICAAFDLSNVAPFKAALDASIFSRSYPVHLVRGITELSLSALQAMFKSCSVSVDSAYLVNDKNIYGEIFSMMAIDSDWCRGYMMLQTEAGEMLDLLRSSAAADAPAPIYHDLNSLLAEASNLVWGSFKNRYVGNHDQIQGLKQIQVPIIINHQRRYISFGTDAPQLCIKYSLTPRNDPHATPAPIFQRFAFNLTWAPELLDENAAFTALLEAGELEVF